MADETEKQAESLNAAGDQRIEPERMGDERTMSAAELASHERGLAGNLDPRGATGGTGAPRDLWDDPQRIRDENARRDRDENARGHARVAHDVEGLLSNNVRLENTVETLMSNLRTLNLEPDQTVS